MIRIKFIINIICAIFVFIVPLYLSSCTKNVKKVQDLHNYREKMMIIDNKSKKSDYHNELQIRKDFFSNSLVDEELMQDMNEEDRFYQANAISSALEHNNSDQSCSWRNPDTGNSGKVTPITTYKDNNGRYCRKYSQKIYISGKELELKSSACRDTDGSWQRVQ